MKPENTEKRMLIVEDDAEMGMGLEDYFDLKGFEVTRATDGERGAELLQNGQPFDIVLLDVMLPKKNGFEVLHEARESGVEAPILMLTVKNQQEDKLEGLYGGADDYVTKPFSVEELSARVKAVLKRANAPSEAPMEVYRFGEVEVNFSNHTAYREDREIQFTALEFDILRYFIQHRNRTLSRKQLLRDVWGISGDITTRTIDRHVASLRKKVEPDPNVPTYIETVYGIGYKFVG